jgi:hypothetical protein
MRLLEEIKNEYVNSGTINYPNKEECDYYSINDAILKKWRTEAIINNRKKLDIKIDEFNGNKEKKIEKKYQIDYIFRYFYMSTNDYTTEDYSYNEIPFIFKKMYINDLFDIFSYEKDSYFKGDYQFYLANLRKTPNEPSIPIHLYDGRKYAGIIPNLYYSNHLDIFEDVLEYYANTIYKKYGLYLQDSMKILISFCNEFKLPYIEMLKKAQQDAQKLDYPSNHEFKYQYVPKMNIKWEN